MLRDYGAMTRCRGLNREDLILDGRSCPFFYRKIVNSNAVRRKLAWQLSRGRRVTCEWDNVSLSELTPAENLMLDEDFLALYPDEVKTRTKKGGRPKKYRTATAQRNGHAERQRQYRQRKLLLISGVTQNPLAAR
jgi:hypothetical protein